MTQDTIIVDGLVLSIIPTTPHAPYLKGLLVARVDEPAIACHLGQTQDRTDVGFGLSICPTPTLEDIKAQEHLNSLMPGIAKRYGFTWPDHHHWDHQKKTLTLWALKDHHPQDLLFVQANRAIPATHWTARKPFAEQGFFAVGYGLGHGGVPAGATVRLTRTSIEQNFVPVAEGINKVQGISSHEKLTLMTQTHPGWAQARASAKTLRAFATVLPSKQGLCWDESRTGFHFIVEGIGQGTIQMRESFILHLTYPHGRASLRHNFTNDGLVLNRGTGGDSRFNSEQDARVAAQKTAALLQALDILYPVFEGKDRQIAHDHQHHTIMTSVLEHALAGAERKRIKRDKVAKEREEAASLVATTPNGRLCGTYMYTRQRAAYALHQIQLDDKGKRTMAPVMHAITHPLTKKWLAKYPPFPNVSILARLPNMGHDDEKRLIIESQHRASFKDFDNPMLGAILNHTHDIRYKQETVHTGYINGDTWHTLVAWTDGSTTHSGWSLAIDMFDEPTIFIRPNLTISHYHTNGIADTLDVIFDHPTFKDHRALKAEFQRQLKKLGTTGTLAWRKTMP